MNFCPKCRKKLVVQDFCVECGADLSEYLNNGISNGSLDTFDFSALEKAEQERTAIEKAQWEVGGSPILGEGPDGNIEWLVLAREENRALLITKKSICAKPYNDTFPYSGITWEQCTLRRWLNTVFYNSYFTENERARILTTTVVTPNNSIYGTSGGNPTNDKIFILSQEEAQKYFKTDSQRSINRRWWTRSVGQDSSCVFIVDDFGEIYDGDSVEQDWYHVRPAMWVYVE